MSYFLGMEILTGIVDGKLKFCVIEDQHTLHVTAGEADAATVGGKHVPFDTIDDARVFPVRTYRTI